MTNSQKLELYVVPLANNLIQYNQLTGSVSINTTSNVVTGSGTSFFDDFEEGDYVYVSTPDLTSANTIRRVVKLNSATSLQVDRPFNFANTNAIFKRAFPQNIPVPFGTRDGLSANVDINGNILTLKFAHANGTSITFEGTTTVNTAVGVNIQRQNVTSSTKIANRNKYVKISLANNEGNTVGPWCIGVPDAFRLRNVYVSNNVSVNTSSPNITSQFYIDHNQNANYLGLGWLYKNPSSSLSLNSNDFLLVEFDYYTRNAEGYFDTVSYLHTANTDQIAELDAKAFAELGEESNSFEVPEVYTYTGEYYDLLNQFDFRPAVSSTVTPSDDHTSAPVNPSYSETFDQVTDKKFPYPDSSCVSQIEQYLGRVDDIYIGEEGNIYALKGIPDVNPKKRFTSNHPKDSLRLQTISVPAYPTVGQILSENMSAILNKGIGNETLLNKRLPSKVATPILTTTSMQHSQPMLYTMEDIGNLERRIRDLEYYVSLSVLETNITNKIIPSSIDANINRFKFGFFADDFATQLYTDLNNPQYSASVEVEGDLPFGSFSSPTDSSSGVANKSQLASSNNNPYPSQIAQKSTNRIVPKKYVWAINQYIGENIPYVDHVILEQNIATTEPVVTVANTQPNTITTNTTITLPNNVTINVSSNVITTNTTSNTGINPCVLSLRPSLNLVGTVSNTTSVYFGTSSLRQNPGIVLNNRAAYDISVVVPNVPVGQNTLIKSILYIYTTTMLSIKLNDPYNQKEVANSVNMTAVSENEASRINQGLIQLVDSPSGVSGFSKNGDQFIGRAKLEFFTRPGERIFINIQRISSSFDWRLTSQSDNTNWSLAVALENSYDYRNATIIDVQSCTPVNPPTGTYTGTITARALTNWSCSNQFRTSLNNSQYTAFILDCTGLKPSTKHDFILDGQNYNEFSYPRPSRADPTGSQGLGFRRSQELSSLGLGSYDLISDSTGKLSLTVYVPIRETRWIINQLGLTGGIFSSGPINQGATYGSSGYSTLEVQDLAKSSYAKLVVADRSPSKVLPNDAAGNI